MLNSSSWLLFVHYSTAEITNALTPHATDVYSQGRTSNCKCNNRYAKMLAREILY